MKLQIVNMILNFIIIAEVTYSCILARQNRKLSEEIKELNLEVLATMAEYRAKLARLPF